MNNELIISEKGSNLIYYCSYFQLIVCLFSFYYKVYDCSLITMVTFYTSINYWKNPIYYSNRRIIDMTCVLSGIIYHGYIIKDYYFSTKYYSLIGVGSLLYPLGFYLNKNKEIMIAVNHCTLQLIADVIAINIYKSIYNEKYNQISDGVN